MISLLFLSLGCNGNEGDYDMVIKVGQGRPKDSSEEEPEPMEEFDTADICSTAPYVNWENKIRGLITTHCQGCHSSVTPYTYGAPESVNFDTEEDTISWKERIQIRVLDEEDMPPAGGLLEEDKYLLQVWLSCWI